MGSPSHAGTAGIGLQLRLGAGKAGSLAAAGQGPRSPPCVRPPAPAGCWHRCKGQTSPCSLQQHICIESIQRMVKAWGPANGRRAERRRRPPSTLLTAGNSTSRRLWPSFMAAATASTASSTSSV